MDKLPKWRFPHTLPAFSELESVTALEAIHMLYGAINKLIEEHNIQDVEIQEAIEYMKDHLEASVIELMNDLLQKGIIHENLKVDYDEATETLTFSLLITDGGE